MDIGNIFVELRGNNTQQKFAESIGISRTYLSYIENNRKSPSIKTLEKLAELTGTKLVVKLVDR